MRVPISRLVDGKFLEHWFFLELALARLGVWLELKGEQTGQHR